MYRPLVSVIIPYYNSQPTIGRCIDSVATQTYRPLEVLLIDDNSSDGSLDIVKQYIENNSDKLLSFKLIRHTENLGSASARISGINAASGEYLTSLDSDDYIDPETVEEYVKASQGGRFDIVAAGMKYEYPDRSEEWLFKPNEKLALKEVTINAMHFSLANKLIRTSSLRDVDAFIHNQNYWEDLGAIARLLASGATATILNRCYYHYVQYNSNSLTKGNQDKVLHQHIQVAKSLEQWMKARDCYAENEEFMLYLKFIAKVKYLRNYSALLAQPVQRLRAWRDTFPESNTRIMSYSKVPLKYRLLFQIAKQISTII